VGNFHHEGVIPSIVVKQRMQRSQVILVFRILLATGGLVHSCSTDKTDREEENEHTNSHTLSQVHCGKRSRIEKRKKKEKKAYSWLATTTNHTTSSSFLYSMSSSEITLYRADGMDVPAPALAPQHRVFWSFASDSD
jgi:hypothetical protein